MDSQEDQSRQQMAVATDRLQDHAEQLTALRLDNDRLRVWLIYITKRKLV